MLLRFFVCVSQKSTNRCKWGQFRDHKPWQDWKKYNCIKITFWKSTLWKNNENNMWSIWDSKTHSILWLCAFFLLVFFRLFSKIIHKLVCYVLFGNVPCFHCLDEPKLAKLNPAKLSITDQIQKIQISGSGFFKSTICKLVVRSLQCVYSFFKTQILSMCFA